MAERKIGHDAGVTIQGSGPWLEVWGRHVWGAVRLRYCQAIVAAASAVISATS
jgi:hypothetical protein